MRKWTMPALLEALTEIIIDQDLQERAESLTEADLELIEATIGKAGFGLVDRSSRMVASLDDGRDLEWDDVDQKVVVAECRCGRCGSKRITAISIDARWVGVCSDCESAAIAETRRLMERRLRNKRK